MSTAPKQDRLSHRGKYYLNGEVKDGVILVKLQRKNGDKYKLVGDNV